jgi:hypothetical protein
MLVSTGTFLVGAGAMGMRLSRMLPSSSIITGFMVFSSFAVAMSGCLMTGSGLMMLVGGWVILVGSCVGHGLLVR